MSQAHKESCHKFSLMCGNLEITLGKKITNFSCKTLCGRGDASVYVCWGPWEDSDPPGATVTGG